MNEPSQMTTKSLADPLVCPAHRAFLVADAHAQFDFFDASLRADGGFNVLDREGKPIPGSAQELHSTTRLVHSYVLGKIAGRIGCDAIIDAGMACLLDAHRDTEHGGYVWALDGNAVRDGRKLAYGHVFVLLAAASAHAVDHPDAAALLNDVEAILDTHFWEDGPGLFRDEWNRDWTPFSTYRGMNANMHGVEALLAAYEATGREMFLIRAGRILDFFLNRIAPSENLRLPEHYTQDWQIDRSYSENPMFRPAGTTPGHSFELARLMLHYNELADTADADRVLTARNVAYRALSDAWDPVQGGLVYTLDFDGQPAIRDRYWWPVTEAIGVLAALLKTDPTPEDAIWYSRLWDFAQTHFIDSQRGGWFPEIDSSGAVTERQFIGKPDIYHSIQAVLFPLTPHVSGVYRDLRGVLAEAPTRPV
jgi:mannose/cellobiose epimerase-like protein (N-acyl-D-glucosamine 2-epimerase family)